MIDEGINIGRYLVQDRIGHGTSGVVHRAWHSELELTVAIKFLPLIHEPTAKSRFSRESRALRRLDHPNILRVLDTGEAEGAAFMVFDYITGGSLDARMAAEPLTDVESISILDGIAKGLDYAHQRGIIHRDVKPANVLINSSGNPVLADFGLARLVEQPSATATGLFAGTPAYMSPEQAEGGFLGPAADQYSLAALAYQMLTGQVPYPGETVSEVLTALLTRDPQPPSTVRPGLSAGVDEAILRGLARKPEDRWPTCQALTDAILHAMVASIPVGAGYAPAAGQPPTAQSEHRDPRLAGLVIEPGEPYLTIVIPHGKAKNKVLRGRRRLLAGAAATIVLLAGLATGLVMSGDAISALAAGHPSSGASVNNAGTSR